MSVDPDPVLCDCGEPAEVATPDGAMCSDCAEERAEEGWHR